MTSNMAAALVSELYSFSLHAKGVQCRMQRVGWSGLVATQAELLQCVPRKYRRLKLTALTFPVQVRVGFDLIKANIYPGMLTRLKMPQ